MQHHILFVSDYLVLKYDALANWISQDWYPRAQQAGLEAHAVVFAADYFGRRSTEKALHRIAGGTIAGFEDVDIARRALLNTWTLAEGATPDPDGSSLFVPLGALLVSYVTQ